jgi:hypothetical protein
MLTDFKKAVEDEPPKKQEEKIEGPESKPSTDDPSGTPRG